jgi:hypothetical protein
MATRLDELENLLNLVWSGELKHDQEEIYSPCGTAACICGWDYALDEHDGCLEDAALNADRAWSHSREKYGLTAAEAGLLFDGYSTKALQEATLSKLKAGESLDCTTHVEVCSSDYNALDVVVSSDSEHTMQLLVEFFDGTSIQVGD